MEIDQLKPATTEEQMEMMLMKMDNKLPDFYLPNYQDVVSSNPSHNDEFTNIKSAVPIHMLETSPSFVRLPNISISFSGGGGELSDHHRQKNSMAEMREMIFRIAAMQPIHIDPESVKPPKRRNVKISKDPQSVAARHRRERISERIRILQQLVPGGTKMDTASVLDEAVHYVKFLKNQVQSLERAAASNNSSDNMPITSTTAAAGTAFPLLMSNGSYVNKPFHRHHQPPTPPPPYNPHQCLQHYGAI